jgi:hypothetical protein
MGNRELKNELLRAINRKQLLMLARKEKEKLVKIFEKHSLVFCTPVCLQIL